MLAQLFSTAVKPADKASPRQKKLCSSANWILVRFNPRV